MLQIPTRPLTETGSLPCSGACGGLWCLPGALESDCFAGRREVTPHPLPGSGTAALRPGSGSGPSPVRGKVHRNQMASVPSLKGFAIDLTFSFLGLWFFKTILHYWKYYICSLLPPIELQVPVWLLTFLPLLTCPWCLAIAFMGFYSLWQWVSLAFRKY